MITLTKGQTINLEKAGGGGSLARVTMGLGWDVRKSKGFFGFGGGADEIDLDASCILFRANKEASDLVWFRQLRSQCGSINHTGDNLTGAGDGDDEQIQVDLTRIPADVNTIIFTVSSFRGDTFDRIENAFCRLVDDTSGKEIARYDLSGSGPHTAQIMAAFYRVGGGWQFKAIGERSNGQTIQNMMPAIMAHVQ
jgi:tellurium resistance protein TerZ